MKKINQPSETGAGSKLPLPSDLPPTSSGNAPNPFDPARLRLTPNLDAGFGVKKLLTAVPVRKPDRSSFVRVHSDPDYRLTTGVIELKDDRGEIYLVAPELREGLVGEATYGVRTLYSAISRQGVVFLWPVKLPPSSGRQDEWSRTAIEAAKRAMHQWVRVQANMSLGAYEVFTAVSNLPDPEWPEVSLSELLRIAFRDRYIETLDHPVLRRLRGEV